MRIHRFHKVATFPWLIAAMTGSSLAAMGEAENKVSAALIYNLVRFVEWPSAAVTDGYLDICLLEEADIHHALLPLDGRQAGSLTIRYRSDLLDDGLPDCEVAIAITTSGAARLAHVSTSTLTVGMPDGFVKRDGIIEIYYRDGKVKFAVNAERARGADLHISSKVMPLADEVIGR
ncbi:YfiR family protein [Parvularcula sp. LCG005]|uniref:YfiR family protein n=1 Tax=Parvularcula sp. LCG005 TaxID=3078805 RepID=UPI0029424F70|nr:YfiR family protein [Parvularcula sp. LCG005]WOI52508.1 YfiR family protein [Parvularcula sp. LCG005]